MLFMNSCLPWNYYGSRADRGCCTDGGPGREGEGAALADEEGDEGEDERNAAGSVHVGEDAEIDWISIKLYSLFISLK